MVSFVIPVYNSEKTIKRCIDSILSQTCGDYEVIAVNDYSQDKSSLMLNEYGSRLILFENSKNRGVSATRNRALKEAKGEWIVFVDSDDYIIPHFVEYIEKESRDDVDLMLWKTETRYTEDVSAAVYEIENRSLNYYSHDSFGLRGGYRYLRTCTERHSEEAL